MKAIIPARGGSKGVPKKNIHLLNGVPLVGHSIIEAKKCKNISKIYVSTDSDEIAVVAKSYGAEIIDRPSKYATDTSLDIDVMRHAVEYLGNHDDIIHLRATTPMVHHDVLDKAIEYFFDNQYCTSLRSAHETPESAYKFFQKKDLYWVGLFDDKLSGQYYNKPRQILPKTYHPNGYIDIVRPSWFMKNDSLHGNKMLAFETPYTHEIDTTEDIKILEALYDQDKKIDTLEMIFILRLIKKTHNIKPTTTNQRILDLNCL